MLILLALACRTKDLPADTAPPTDTSPCPEGGELDDYLVDADGDGFGGEETVTACLQPEGAVSVGGDCDDDDATVWPGAAERCDGVDNDCNGEVDEEVQDTWFADADGDGWGDATSTLDDCDPPDGYVANDSDCDDDEAASFPTNTEICDGLDNNCDGLTDEGVTSTFYPDKDDDGHGSGEPAEFCEQPSGYADSDEDCDDDDAEVNPDATELCNDQDDDCDGEVDEDEAQDATTWSIDVDGDGFGSDSYQLTQCEQPAGYVLDDTDCDDTDEAVNTDGVEVCDGVDNDCDGTSDNDDATDASTWYADADGDGFGDSSTTTTACEQPSSYVDDTSDCDDTDGTVYPGAQETPSDGTDQNCDGYDGCLDLNCDSYADLLIPVHYTAAYGADSLVFYGSTTGLSDSNSDILPGDSSLSAAAEDFDGDGFVDLLLPGYYSAGYATDTWIYYGSVTGFSSTNATSLPSQGAYGSLAEDLDGDGYLDIVLANYNGGSATNSFIYYGSATGFSASNSTGLSNNGAIEVRAAELNGDSYTDLVFCNHYAGGYGVNSHIFYGAATGFSSNNMDAVPTSGCFDLEIEDFNSDGYEDIIFANYSGSYSYLYWGTSGGFSTSYIDYLPTSNSLGVESSDFDQDGYVDIALAGYNGSTRVYWNSSAGFSSTVYDALAGGAYQPRAADLDNDGYDELIVPVYYSGGYSTNSYVYWGTNTGFSSSNRTSLPTVGATKVGVGDLDADGYPEIIFNNYYTGSWSTSADTYVYWGSTSGYTSTDRTDLDTYGSWGTPIPVGDTDW